MVGEMAVMFNCGAGVSPAFVGATWTVAPQNALKSGFLITKKNGYRLPLFFNNARFRTIHHPLTADC
jgi:hypothetical protein